MKPTFQEKTGWYVAIRLAESGQPKLHLRPAMWIVPCYALQVTAGRIEACRMVGTLQGPSRMAMDAESGVSPGRCGNFVPEPTEPQALQLATVGASLPQWVAEIPAG